MKHKLSSVSKTVALAVLSAFIVTTAAPPATADLIGLVKRVKSEGYGTPPGAERERKYLRFPVVQDERLETGSGGGMLVEFLDETTLTLGPKSDLVIDTFVYDPKANEGTAIMTMGVGIMHFVSGKAQYAAMQIKTPTAVIGIRGSEALIAVAEDGTTTVSVFDGEFSVSNSEGGVGTTVGPQQSVSVSTTGTVSAPAPAPSAPPDEVSLPAQKVGYGGAGGGRSPGARGGGGGGTSGGGGETKLYDDDHGLDDDHHDDHGYDDHHDDHPEDEHNGHNGHNGNGNGNGH